MDLLDNPVARRPRTWRVPDQVRKPDVITPDERAAIDAFDRKITVCPPGCRTLTEDDWLAKRYEMAAPRRRGRPRQA